MDSTVHDAEAEPDPVLSAAWRYAPDAASAASTAAAQPWTIAVVGRVGAGKTTWINRATGTARPVGLGGVTTAIEPIPWTGGLLLDTPGIDGLDSAISGLGAAIGGADAVLWIVDGLQPATRTEREVLAATLLPGTASAAVISRLDLVEPEQHDAIRERVRQVLEADHSPTGGDLRAIPIALPDAVEPAPTSARRSRLREHAVRQALATLEALPPIEGRAELGRRLADRWRERVRSCVEEVSDRSSGRPSDHPVEAKRALATAAVEVRDGFLSELGDEPALARALAQRPPSLPLPDPQAHTALGMVAAAMGGEHRARVRLREQAARWMTDGLLALAEWIGDAPGIDAAAAAREADWKTLTEAKR